MIEHEYDLRRLAASEVNAEMKEKEREDKHEVSFKASSSKARK